MNELRKSVRRCPNRMKTPGASLATTIPAIQTHQMTPHQHYHRLPIEQKLQNTASEQDLSCGFGLNPAQRRCQIILEVASIFHVLKFPSAKACNCQFSRSTNQRTFLGRTRPYCESKAAEFHEPVATLLIAHHRTPYHSFRIHLICDMSNSRSKID